MVNAKILIVEDDRNISKLIKYNLEKSGYDCVAAFTGAEALKAVRTGPFDLVALDLMLPEIDGMEVCRTIKQDEKLKDIPIVILTAKGEEVDRVVGFELGADDYIVKPFSVRELVLRIKAILKRYQKEEPSRLITIGDICADIPKHKITAGKKEIDLTPMEFKLLVLLMERQGRVQTREMLLSNVWNINADIDTRTIDTHIKRLRKKLGKSGNLIETVHGYGYKLKEEK